MSTTPIDLWYFGNKILQKKWVSRVTGNKGFCLVGPVQYTYIHVHVLDLTF